MSRHSRQEPLNVGDEIAVAERNKKVSLQQDKFYEDLKNICKDKRVRDYLWALISRCGVYKTSFTGNSETFMKEGRRQIGLEVIADLFKADDNIYSLMRLEAAQKEKE